MKIKLILFIIFLFSYNTYADYTSHGQGETRGEAYVSAMSGAPSGPHWILDRIYYSPDGGCFITWKIKNN